MFLDKLKRSPARGRYIPELDGLRFLAILGVVLYHAHCHFFPAEPIEQWNSVEPNRWAEYLIGKGYFGVQLFFIISGFIIAIPFARFHLGLRERPVLKNFYLRRVKRIEIPYFITLTCGYFGLVFVNGATFTEHFWDFIQGLTYTFNLFNPERLNPILQPAWTLELEIQFYLLTPLLCLIYKLKQQWLRIGIFLLGMLLIPILLDLIHDWSGREAQHVLLGKGFIIRQLPFFFAGMLALDFHLNHTKGKLPQLWDALGVFSALATWHMLSYYQVSDYLPFSLGLFVLGVVKGSWLKSLLSLRFLTIFGGMSYSIYLFHGMILHFIVLLLSVDQSQLSDTWSLIGIGLTTIVIFILCIPFYLLIEKPFMRKPPSEKTNR